MAKKNEVATTENIGGMTATAPAFDLSKAVLKRRLVLQTISIAKLPEGGTIYLRADGELYQRQQSDAEGKPKVDKDNVPVMLDLINVTDMNTGEQGQMVVPVIAKKGFAAATDDGPLLGRFFAMKRGKSTGANKANMWEVVEFTMSE